MPADVGYGILALASRLAGMQDEGPILRGPAMRRGVWADADVTPDVDPAQAGLTPFSEGGRVPPEVLTTLGVLGGLAPQPFGAFLQTPKLFEEIANFWDTTISPITDPAVTQQGLQQVAGWFDQFLGLDASTAPGSGIGVGEGASGGGAIGNTGITVGAPQGPSAVVMHRGGLVRDRQRRPLREELVTAQEGEYVIARGPAKKHRALLEAINAGASTGELRKVLAA